MITGEVRLSYVKVWEAEPDDNGRMKYSCCVMVPADDTDTLNEMHEEVQEAIKKGVASGLFTKKQVPGLKLPLRDGTAEAAAGKKGPEYDGMIFVNTSRFAKNGDVGVVTAQNKPMLDQGELYSGVWALVDLNFFPFKNKGNRGVGAGLNNIMKVKDDERLDGRMAATDAFADYAKGAGESDEDIPF